MRKLCKSWTLISLKTFLRKLCKLLPSRICRKNNFIEFQPNPTIFVLSTVGFWSVLEPKTGPQDPKIKIFQNEKKPPEVFSQRTSVPIFSQIHQTLASLGCPEDFQSIFGENKQITWNAPAIYREFSSYKYGQSKLKCNFLSSNKSYNQLVEPELLTGL